MRPVCMRACVPRPPTCLSAFCSRPRGPRRLSTPPPRPPPFCAPCCSRSRCSFCCCCSSLRSCTSCRSCSGSWVSSSSGVNILKSPFTSPSCTHGDPSPRAHPAVLKSQQGCVLRGPTCSTFASSSKYCMPFCIRAISMPGATLLGSTGALVTALSLANVKAECVKPGGVGGGDGRGGAACYGPCAHTHAACTQAAEPHPARAPASWRYRNTM